MTRIDLAAIRARAEAATYYGGDEQERAEDTLALLAEVERLTSERDDLAAKIEQVEALHVRHEFEDSPAVYYCGHCQVTAGLWPCPTVAALADPKET